ncbi:NosD domain-containing protein [Nocardioides sp.]|uniref:NosD domain-containing protein n=1 Tax=Nocardioides sp. TaxID=35761 RepID=UPI002BF20BA8|nr:NosD domain-containing protein [Nocardioides sp.]HXH81161.1 NosD domain-containing protein [Nocardioides sp.]
MSFKKRSAGLVAGGTLVTMALVPFAAPTQAADSAQTGAQAAVRDNATAQTWRVGPGRPLATPSAAAAVARDGDTVLIDPGTYVGDVATWTQDDLTLRGDGGLAHLQAGGKSAQGKAIWVIAGDRTVVDSIEFSGAAVTDKNGAGIRQEGVGLTVTRSWFHDNQNGILTGASPTSDIVIRDSRFFSNGAGDGYSHNLYIGAVRSLTVSGSYIWGAKVGHELKSRAAQNTIIGNRITDADAATSYSIDLPNGGRSLIAGNVIIQGPNSPNSTLVSYAAEGFPATGSRELWVVNNTFVNRRTAGTFVRLATGSQANLHNNLMVGPGSLTNLTGVPASANIRVGLQEFVNPATDDFRLLSTSSAINRGVQVPEQWRATSEYEHPTRLVPRPVVGPVDIGAYEWR